MALSEIEQIEITKGNVKPPNYQLIDLVHHIATINAKSFYNKYKDGFDEGLNANAVLYRNKTFRISDLIFKQDVNTIKSLTRIIVVILGASEFTFAQVDGATDDEWATFITGQMNEAFELLGGIKKIEKTEYDAI